MRVDRVLIQALNSPDELPKVVMNGPADRVMTDEGKTNSPGNSRKHPAPRQPRVASDSPDNGIWGAFLQGSSLCNYSASRCSLNEAGSWTFLGEECALGLLAGGARWLWAFVQWSGF